MTSSLRKWATHSAPLLGCQSRQSTQRSRRVRWLALGSILLLTALGVSGCTVVADVPSGAAGQTLTERIIEMLLYPMLIVQTALGVSVLALTIAGNNEGSGPETSNNQAEAPVSAAATVRARWLAAINRLRPGLIFLTLVRLVLIGLVLRDLTAFQGSYLALLVSDTPLSVPTAALVLFVSFAAALSIPFTMLAFDGAAGVLLSVLLKKRLYTLSFQVVEFVLRVAFVIGVTWLTLGFVAGTRPLEPWLAWLAVFGAGAGADWGLMMMHLGFSSDVWRTIPLGVFIGPALLLFALGQAIFAAVFLRFAAMLVDKRH